MILACPLCQTRFLIPASLFAAGPRRVRCARCLHSWLAEAPNHIDVVAPPADPVLPEAPLPSPLPIPEGSNLPALMAPQWPKWMKKSIVLTFLIVIVGLGLWLVLDRQSISKQWPRLEHIYDNIGLHIYYPGEGLTLMNVRSELKYEDGMMRLVTDGIISNTTDNTQKIPDLMAGAVGPGGEITQSWQIDAPAATVAPHGETPFHSMINAPKETVVNVNLNFIEPKDDSK